MELGEQRRICVSSSFESVRKLASFSRKACKEHFSEEILNTIELAVVEAANNIVEHAYADEDGGIEFDITCEKESVRFGLFNTGKPFENNALPDLETEDWDDIENVPERGRGLFLLNSIMDEVVYSRKENFNTLIMRKTLEIPPEGDKYLHPFIYRATDNRLNLLFNFAGEIPALTRSGKVFQHLIERVASILEADWATLRLKEGNEFILYARYGDCPQSHCSRVLKIAENSIEAQTVVEKKILSRDYDDDECGSMLSLPIGGIDRQQGVILLGKDVRGFFDIINRNLAKALAELVCVILETHHLNFGSKEAEIIREEWSVATNLHKNLITQMLPNFPGLELFANSEPALQVGGDYLTFHVESKNVLWFMICDAMGKGMSANFFSILSHMTFKSILFMQMDISPGGLLMLSNIIMDQDFDRFGMFMTALVGKIDLKTNTLDYASAGHCPPIIYKNGEIEMLDTQDYMLGVDPEVEYKTYSIPFEKGDKLLAYTDGITDIIGPDGEMIGIEPLLYACSTEFKSKGVKEACEKIFTEALMVSGRNLQDDITMIGIERK